MNFTKKLLLVLSLFIISTTSIAVPPTFPDLQTASEEFNEFLAEIKQDRKGRKYIELVVNGTIGAKSFDKTIALLEDMRGGGLPILIQINTDGGDAGALFALFQTIRNWDGPLITINNGAAFSCGALIYMIGDVRVARLNSLTMFHGVQFQYPERLNMSELVQLIEEIREFNQQLYDIAVEETNQPEGVIRSTWFDDMEEDNFLTPSQLQQYGLLDLMFNDYFKIFQSEGIEGVLIYRNHDQQDFENRGGQDNAQIVLGNILRAVEDILERFRSDLSRLLLA